MSSHQQNQDRHQNDRKPRYYNNRRNNYSSGQYKNHHVDRYESGSDVAAADNAASGNIDDFSASRNRGDYTEAYEASSSRNPQFSRNHHRPSKSRYGANSQFPRGNRNSNVHMNDRSIAESSQLNANAPSFKSAYEHPVHETEPNVSQRGEIVGGRYIRKHSNQSSAHSYSNNDASSENVEPNSNFSSNSHNYNTPRHKSNYFDNQRSRSKGYSGGGDTRNSYKPHRNNNYSSKFSHNDENENEFASSDVYRFSSKNNDKKAFKSVKEFSRNHSTSSIPDNNATQRELLIQQLNKGDCECLVCCEQIRVKDQIWHCLSCFHVFHLRCIRKWARSPAASGPDKDWRCPACQSLNSTVPFDYYCFCGACKNPDVNYHLTPHSCGEICGRTRPDCTHRCKELCHPGPCPPCAVIVQKACSCGKTVKALPCKHDIEETCNSVCEKVLNCGAHICKAKCHPGECEPCEEQIDQECYCKKSKRTVTCDSDTSNVHYFCCGNVCGSLLNCGNHTCDNVCHPAACRPCSLSTEVVKYCPCKKTSIEELITSGKAQERKSCTDPIPLCDKKCEKLFPCGPKDNHHRCQSSCHEGECPKCPLTTSLKCRCGSFTKEFNCADIGESFEFLCKKRCSKFRDCGRHKCLNNCCILPMHKCELICNRRLSCGKHQCQDTCHPGNCLICGNVSFDELRCHCGESVLYPPIHCGTPPPECTKPCIRSHPCDHDVKHTCHSEETCPPCTSLTSKWCYGHHKQCVNVMCFLDGVSCGMMCSKNLPCGKHKCKLTCHAGLCLKEGSKCTQLCTTPRSSCGHPCGNPCHDNQCPETPCKFMVTLVCPCGHLSETTTCYDSTKSYQYLSVSVLVSKMQEIKEGQSVNLNDIRKKSKNSKLQCNEECAVLERNKRLAVALQIQNPELSTSPGPPNYSDFLKTEAKKNPSFVADVYDKISELVQLAKESKQKCRSHSFAPMNRDHRRVIHELAEFFGCETQSYDEEPKKSVVVTAYKNKCWLPFVSIMAIVQRDMGFRKGPAPVINQSKNPSSSSTTSNCQMKKIDYFDYKE
ncbi:protein shuttle craft [Trichonephila clavata]|uniref:Protein shuttle craft n=1 Tax=Trichonephila clavata TaxID=2740835 RepID=A0A8X6FZK0_TRICU|nr:protein shuttle craft [Trichonephila clavata]